MGPTPLPPTCLVLPGEQVRELDTWIAGLGARPDDRRRKGHLVQVLHKAQAIFGYLPDEVQRHIARRLGLQHAEVSGVISFYNYFTTVPRGKLPISICMGTACYVKGAAKVLAAFERALGIKAGQVTADGLYSLDQLRCVGACGLAPVVLVGEKVHGRVAEADVARILAESGVPAGEA